MFSFMEIVLTAHLNKLELLFFVTLILAKCLIKND